MRKYSIIVGIGIIAVTFLAGFSGLKLVNTTIEGSNEDQLIGILVTDEYLDLFDFESYLNDNVSSFSDGGTVMIDDAQEYQGRLYAELVREEVTNEETGETFTTFNYVFPDVDGTSLFSAHVIDEENQEEYSVNGDNDGITDVHVNYNVTDFENTTEMEGTIYFLPEGEENSYYFNPVFQSEDGRVYATSGSGFCANSDTGEGSIYSQKLDSSTQTEENGIMKKESISVKISLAAKFPAKSVDVIQMTEENQFVSSQTYNIDELPEEITPDKETFYLIVVENKVDGEGNAVASRTVYGADDENFEIFTPREDGICAKQSIGLNWK